MKSILIVEDSPTMRAMLTSALEELDPPVKLCEAANGFEALRVLPRERFDLVITDINMPDINGLELVSFVRGGELQRDTPILIVSTESSSSDRDRGMELGADAYLTKPFDSQELLDVVCGLLER